MRLLLALVLAETAPGSDGRARFEAFDAARRAGTLEVYPARAKAMGVDGRAVLNCRVDEEGWLQDCAVTDERPADQGFGDAAMKMVPGFRKYAERGQRVEIPIDFGTGEED